MKWEGETFVDAAQRDPNRRRLNSDVELRGDGLLTGNNTTTPHQTEAPALAPTTSHTDSGSEMDYSSVTHNVALEDLSLSDDEEEALLHRDTTRPPAPSPGKFQQEAQNLLTLRQAYKRAKTNLLRATTCNLFRTVKPKT